MLCRLQISIYLYTFYSEGTDFKKKSVLTVLAIFAGLVEWGFVVINEVPVAPFCLLPVIQNICVPESSRAQAEQNGSSGAAFCPHPRANFLLLNLLPGVQRANCPSEGKWMCWHMPSGKWGKYALLQNKWFAVLVFFLCRNLGSETRTDLE